MYIFKEYIYDYYFAYGGFILASLLWASYIFYKSRPPKIYYYSHKSNSAGLHHAYFGDAGFDLECFQDVIIPPGTTAKVPVSLSVMIPPGYHGIIVARSSFALKNNASIKLGIIDAGYTEQLSIIVQNNRMLDLELKKGECYAQLIIQKTINIKPVQVDNEENLEINAKKLNLKRLKKGFGSSNVK